MQVSGMIFSSQALCTKLNYTVDAGMATTRKLCSAVSQYFSFEWHRVIKIIFAEWIEDLSSRLKCNVTAPILNGHI